jgi:hypothetical protein
MENKDVVQPVEENLEAQTLQPETVVETAKEEVAQQTQQVAAEQTQQVAEQGFRPNKKQTAVAVQFVVAEVLSFLTANFGMLIPYGDLGMQLYYLSKVLFVFCWLSLAFMAVNKAAKVAAFIGTGTMAVYFLCNMPALVMNNFAICIVALVIALGLSYAVSLIVRNCEMTRTSRTWINLLALYDVFNFSVFFFGFCFMQEWIDQYEGLFYPVQQQVFTLSPYYTTLVLVQVLLVTFAYWKLARCEAFSGKYDAEAVPNFSPMNKWMAMAVIVPVVIVVALAVIYNNCTWFI